MTIDDDELRALLDEAARIDDDGFTDRVMRALPARAPVDLRPRAAWTHLLVLVATLGGCAAAYASTGGGRSFARATAELCAGHLDVLALTAIAVAAMVAMLGAATASAD